MPGLSILWQLGEGNSTSIATNSRSDVDVSNKTPRICKAWIKRESSLMKSRFATSTPTISPQLRLAPRAPYAKPLEVGNCQAFSRRAGFGIMRTCNEMKTNSLQLGFNRGNPANITVARQTVVDEKQWKAFGRREMCGLAMERTSVWNLPAPFPWLSNFPC